MKFQLINKDKNVMLTKTYKHSSLELVLYIK